MERKRRRKQRIMIGTDLCKRIIINDSVKYREKYYMRRRISIFCLSFQHSFSKSPQLIIFLPSYNPNTHVFIPMKPQRPNNFNANSNPNLQPRSPQNKPIATSLHPSTKNEPSSTTQDHEDIQSIAMNLSAGIFMSSTTKFMKGLPGINASAVSPASKQKKPQSPLTTNPLHYISTLRNSSPGKLSARNLSLSKQKNPPVVYPSKAKIQTIVNGKSSQYSKQINANSDLKKVLNRNRVNSNSSRNGRNASSSYSQSRSGSVSRLSRRRKVRELKFVEKKQRQDDTVHEESKKLTDSMMPSKNDTKIRVKIGPMKTASESQISIQATYKVAPKTQTQLSNVKSLKNIHQIKSQQNLSTTEKPKKIEEKKRVSSIISDISPKNASVISGYKMNALLPSGELPLETPVKPMKTQKKGSKETEVSLILEENSSQIKSSKYKSKKNTTNHGSSKEESSTFIEFNPTQVVNTAKGRPNQNSNISKFPKNQSTKAIGKEQQQMGISTIIRMQQQGSKNESKANVVSMYEPKKTPARNETVKDVQITVKPIANSLSFFDVSSPKKNSLNEKEKGTQGPSISVARSCRKSLLLQHVLQRLYCKNMKNSLIQIKQSAKSQSNLIKKAQIFLSSLVTIYKNLSLTNKRMSFQRLKKVTLSIFTHPQPTLKAIEPHNVVANLIHRVSKGKISQYFMELKLKSLANVPFKTLTPQKDPSKTVSMTHDEHNRLYILSQLLKIQQSSTRNVLRKALTKLQLKAISQRITIKPIEPQAIKSSSKYPKSPRNYESDLQKLTRNQELLSSEIYKLEIKVADKKRSTNMQKSKLQRKQDDFSKLNKKLQQQVKQIRQKNYNLKNHLDLTNPQEQLDICLPECQPLIGLLTDIYSFVFQTPQTIFDPKTLISNYSISQQYQNPLLQIWQALSRNTSLKAQLSQYQGNLKVTHPKQILLQQQHLITKVLRSYIQERYLWQRLKVSASTL